MSVKILLHGGTGRLGSEIAKLVSDTNAEIVAALNRSANPNDYIALCDVLIDTSVHTASTSITEVAAKGKKPLIIGTTGHTLEELEAIKKFSKDIPILLAPNFSIVVNLLTHLTELGALHLDNAFQAEIIEVHHSGKKDSPSGTATALANIILKARDFPQESIIHGRRGTSLTRSNQEIAIHSLRAGDTIGEHTIIFSGPGERLELIHKASDRCIFAQGALKAAQWIIHQKPGLYAMKDIFKTRSQNSSISLNL